MDLNNKVALVTGAAHRVGKGIAFSLAAAGAHVIIHYGGSADKAEATRTEIETTHDVEAITAQADLSDPDAIQELMTTVAEHFGRLDVLVNSAAIFDHGDFDSITLEQWQRSIDINLRAPFLLTQQAARLMGTQRPEAALIVNIADNSGLYAWEKFTQHGISKAGLIHLTRLTARILAPAIRVNALALGPIIPTQGMAEDHPVWQRTIDALPLGYSGSPQGVGGMVVSLAQTDFITGAIIPMDSGEGLLGPATN